MNMMGSRRLLGKGIYSQDGHEVGEVQGFEIDVDNWRIEAFEVKLERSVLEILNLKKPMFGTQSVRISVDRISGAAEKVILKDDLAGLVFVEL